MSHFSKTSIPLLILFGLCGWPSLGQDGDEAVRPTTAARACWFYFMNLDLGLPPDRTVQLQEGKLVIPSEGKSHLSTPATVHRDDALRRVDKGLEKTQKFATHAGFEFEVNDYLRERWSKTHPGRFNPFLATELVFPEDGSQPYLDMPTAGEPISIGEFGPDHLQKLENLTEAVNTVSLFMNASGVFHKDLKPSNFLIDSQGRVSVIDFGISRFNGRETGNGIYLRGTLNYLPAELFASRDRYDLIDPYSLQVMYAELALGESLNSAALEEAKQTESQIVEMASKSGPPKKDGVRREFLISPHGINPRVPRKLSMALTVRVYDVESLQSLVSKAWLPESEQSESNFVEQVVSPHLQKFLENDFVAAGKKVFGSPELLEAWLDGRIKLEPRQASSLEGQINSWFAKTYLKKPAHLSDGTWARLRARCLNSR